MCFESDIIYLRFDEFLLLKPIHIEQLYHEITSFILLKNVFIKCNATIFRTKLNLPLLFNSFSSVYRTQFLSYHRCFLSEIVPLDEQAVIANT